MHKLYKYIFVLFLLGIFNLVNAQGCVAIRGGSSCGLGSGSNISLNKGSFLVGTGFRYFQSFRHFRGDEHEHHRLEEGTQVINDSYFIDLNFSYGLTDRLYVNATLPFVYHLRSSMYEHGGNPPNGLGERHTTSSSGISDVRLSAGYWLIDPVKMSPFNASVGLGVKLPTGKYDYKDVFYNQGENRDENREVVVDQSIQPGDGGYGVTLDLLGYYAINHRLSLSANFYYLLGVQETNGVLTRSGRSEFSCPDQFAGRLGMYIAPGIPGLSLYLGARTEGVTASDLIGGSAGYRRPGFAISADPGLSYTFSNFQFDVNVPIALYRNRIQSFEDKVRTEETGVYRHGDAAFADYLLNFSLSYRFGGMSGIHEAPTTIQLN